MSENRIKTYDITVIGSGFAGSITAMGLHKLGYSVCLIEKEKHPRFTIGESSTPIADMVLRSLADEYELPFLKKISRYGDWQKHYPEVVCGLKRGFSYYPHQKGKPFKSSKDHENELLVAASVNDENSDTNWLRSDVDHFLLKQAQSLGINYMDETEITDLTRLDGKLRWNVEYKNNAGVNNLRSNWLIDATGSPKFSETFFATKSSADDFYTNSETVFTHFNHAPHWLDYLNKYKFYTDDYPYNPDFSALHHLTEEGWIWMLRFNNDLLSAGLLLDRNQDHAASDSPENIWKSIIKKYPSLHQIFKHAKIAENPGRMIATGRLQRKLDQMYGDGWIALNHTAGFIDPLHSTGIAFALTGVEKILSLFSQKPSDDLLISKFKKIQDQTFNELKLIDLIVSSGYKSRWNFNLFAASVMLYFIASIRYEQSRIKGERPDSFLCSDDQELFDIISQTHQEIAQLEKSKSEGKAKGLVEKIEKKIRPYNPVGLMDPHKKNMYRHTAITL